MNEKQTNKELGWGIVYIRCMAMAFIITIICLLLVALLWYKADLSSNVLSSMMVAVYIIANFWGGWSIGKKVGKRKFIWGLLLGMGYFLIVLLTAFVGNGYTLGEGKDLFLTGLLCGLSGMLGGMVS